MKAERPKSSDQETAAATAAVNPEVTPTGSQVAEGPEVQTGTPAGVLPDSQSAGSLMTDGPIKEDEVDYEGPKAAESGSEDIDPKHHWDTPWESSESAKWVKEQRDIAIYGERVVVTNKIHDTIASGALYTNTIATEHNWYAKHAPVGLLERPDVGEEKMHDLITTKGFSLLVKRTGGTQAGAEEEVKQAILEHTPCMMKGLSWGAGALKKHKSEWQARSYTEEVSFLPPVQPNLRLLVGSQMAEGQGSQSSAAPIYKPGEVQSDSSNDSGQRVKQPQPRWIEESKEVKNKIAWRKADLKKAAAAKHEDLSKQDPLNLYGAKQQRLAKGTDDEIPKKKSNSMWQWNSQLVSSDELEARKKAELALARTKRWKQESNKIWQPVLRQEGGEESPPSSKLQSSSTDKGASSWKPKG